MASCSQCPSKDKCPSVGDTSCNGSPTDSQQANSSTDSRQSGNQLDAEQSGKPSLLEPHALAQVRSVIGICSGKGGVGKSMVTSLLAINLARKGLTVGIMDADITGPSIPKSFGLRGQISGSADGIFPAQTHGGIQVVSINLLLENPEAPVIWRGPVISGVVRQFWTDVIWDGLDVLLIDMPPGTGDVPLTIFQSVPLDGILMVSTPQDLVSLIVRKARNMALMMQVKILGFIENMSSVKCPDCDHTFAIFGPGHTAEAAAEMNVPLFDQLAIDPVAAALCDKGELESYTGQDLAGSVDAILRLVANKPA